MLKKGERLGCVVAIASPGKPHTLKHEKYQNDTHTHILENAFNTFGSNNAILLLTWFQRAGAGDEVHARKPADQAWWRGWLALRARCANVRNS